MKFKILFFTTALLFLAFVRTGKSQSGLTSAATLEGMMPPAITVTNDAPRPAALELEWSASVSAGVVSYNILACTNGIIYREQNFKGLSGLMTNLWLNFTNVFYGQAIASNGMASALSAPYSFSGWGAQPWIGLFTGPLNGPWTNVWQTERTNRATYYRIGWWTTKVALP